LVSIRSGEGSGAFRPVCLRRCTDSVGASLKGRDARAQENCAQYRRPFGIMTSLHTKRRGRGVEEGGGGNLKRRATFFREFLRAPGKVGSIAPSSPTLARRMLAGIDFAKVSVVVEFGPGVGTFTRAVLDRLPHGWLASEGGRGRFIAIELSHAMAEMIRREHPGITVHTGSAADVVEICKSEGVEPGMVDCVVSGIAWTTLPDGVRTQILESTSRALRSGGEFRTFGYYSGLVLRGAWHLRSELRRLFGDVNMSRAVWANLPPAFVYRCVK